MPEGWAERESVRKYFSRLDEVAGSPGFDVAGMVIKDMMAERKSERIKKPERCVMLACSTAEEEMARWRFGLTQDAAERSIKAARNVVNQHLDRLKFGQNWHLEAGW